MMLEINTWVNRDNIPKYVKYKEKPQGSHLVNYKNEKDYNYYICDYCGKEIIIQDKKEETDGGIAVLPNTLTGRGNIKVVLHNRCLNPLLKQFNKDEEKRKITLLSLFSGLGAFEKALKNINQDYGLFGFSEINQYAIKSYCAIHNVEECKNLGDITNIDINKLPKNIDMITHGSPCQDFSIAGKQVGAEKGSGTRSSLMWNTVDIIKVCLPKYVIWENVKNILSQKHKHNFDNYIKILEELGYNNYYRVLNAKDYGIPQKRERVYTISIRKDIDKGTFKFPKIEELKLRLKDMLEEVVDEKYYLSDEKISKIANWKAYQKPFEKVLGKNSIAPTLTARGAGEEHSGMIIYSEDLTETTNLQEEILKDKVTFKFRKITPKESFRLMGFDDVDFEKAAKVNGDTQLYKQARK